MLSRIVFGLIAIAMAVAFLAVPVAKLLPALGSRAFPLLIVILIGIVMMVYEFIETVRDSKDDSES